MRNGPITVARTFWNAFGERDYCDREVQQAKVSTRLKPKRRNKNKMYSSKQHHQKSKDSVLNMWQQTCSGLNCVMVPTSLKKHPQPIVQEYHWCKLCFGNTDRQRYFHTSNDDKRASHYQMCQVAKNEHQAGICKHCCMLLDKSVEERGKKEDHNEGLEKCVVY